MQLVFSPTTVAPAAHVHLHLLMELAATISLPFRRLRMDRAHRVQAATSQSIACQPLALRGTMSMVVGRAPRAPQGLAWVCVAMTLHLSTPFCTTLVLPALEIKRRSAVPLHVQTDLCLARSLREQASARRVVLHSPAWTQSHRVRSALDCLPALVQLVLWASAISIRQAVYVVQISRLSIQL